MTTRKIWISFYCNFAHDVKTGAPIKHECKRLNPYAMRLERAGVAWGHPMAEVAGQPISHLPLTLPSI